MIGCALENRVEKPPPRTSSRRRKNTTSTSASTRNHENVKPVLVTITPDAPEPEVETPDQTSREECLSETTDIVSAVPNVASVIPTVALATTDVVSEIPIVASVTPTVALATTDVASVTPTVVSVIPNVASATTGTESTTMDETQDTTTLTSEAKAEAQENNVVSDTTSNADDTIAATESQTDPVIETRRFAPIMALEDILPVDQCTTNPTTGDDNDTTIDDAIHEFIDRVVDPILHSVSPPPSVLSCSQRCKTLVLTLTMEQRARLYQCICNVITTTYRSIVSSACLQKLDGVCFWLHTHYTNLPHIQKPCFSSL